MNDRDTATRESTISAVLEGDTKITLGDSAIKAIRGEQMETMYATRIRIEAAFDALPHFDAADARSALEQLGLVLDEASTAVSALWWLTDSTESRNEA